MARRQLNREQKQELIREQLRETPEKSDRQIARDLGVSHVRVGKVRKDMESIGQIDQCDRQIAAGLGVDKNTVNTQRKNMESTGEIHHVEKAVDTLGREQPRERKTAALFIILCGVGCGFQN